MRKISIAKVTTGFVAGLCMTCFIFPLPPKGLLLSVWMGIQWGYWKYRYSLLQWIGMGILGIVYMSCHVTQYETHQFPADLNNQVLQIEGIIDDLPEPRQRGQQLYYRIPISVKHVKSPVASQWTNPGRILIYWHDTDNDLYRLSLGQTWRFSAKLKQSSRYANPGSRDNEKIRFQQRFHAQGTVLKQYPIQLVAQKSFSVRQPLWGYIAQALEDKPFRGVILALVLGYRASIMPEQWAILQQTGTAHLVAISGLHISLLTSLTVFLLKQVVKRLPMWGYRWFIPIPQNVSYITLFVLCGYAALSGGSCSIQRACIMSSIGLSAWMLQRTLSKWHSFFAALLAVVLWEPFVVLSLGFWLSFVSVAVLMLQVRPVLQQAKSWKTGLVQWLKTQMALFLTLSPIILYGFGKVAWVAPLANAIAIPWVSWVVLPVALSSLGIATVSKSAGVLGLQLSETLFAGLWDCLVYLSFLNNRLSHAFPQPGLLVTVLACLGGIWISSPRGFPKRWQAWWCFMPLLLGQRMVQPDIGELRVTVLDVGQGLSVVLQTKQHVLVYDVGDKISDQLDLGQQVVVPFLKSQGIYAIDRLILSHQDRDHIGGAEAVLNNLPVHKVMVGESLPFLAGYQRQDRCQAGQTWQWDGVRFAILHPDPSITEKKHNNASCVLQVSVNGQAILITGDIEQPVEKRLVQRYQSTLHSTVLLVPHHGSKTSSHPVFLAAVQAEIAISSVGWMNRHRHPHPAVVRRYHDGGSYFLQTAHTGAIQLSLGKKNKKIQPKCYRIESQRFWHRAQN